MRSEGYCSCFVYVAMYVVLVIHSVSLDFHSYNAHYRRYRPLLEVSWFLGLKMYVPFKSCIVVKMLKCPLSHRV